MKSCIKLSLIASLVIANVYAGEGGVKASI